MDEQKLQKFLQWLPSKFEEFQNKSLDEVAETLNGLYKTQEGKQTIQTLWDTFNQEADSATDPNLFKKGGKLDYLVQLNKKGGKVPVCECGCTMTRTMEKGGIVDKCACGCKTKKVKSKQLGGNVNNIGTSKLGDNKNKLAPKVGKMDPIGTAVGSKDKLNLPKITKKKK